jgi:hypothetical protein
MVACRFKACDICHVLSVTARSELQTAPSAEGSLSFSSLGRTSLMTLLKIWVTHKSCWLVFRFVEFAKKGEPWVGSRRLRLITT